MSRVLVVGSINLDLVIRAERFPEPGETLGGGAFATFPGGKGANQAVAASRLGAEVALLGCVGGDAFGDRLLSGMAAEGVDTGSVRRAPHVASGVAMILSSSLVIQSFSDERRSVLSALHYAGIGVGISASAVLTWWLLTLGYHFDIIWLVAGIISLPLLWLLYAIRPQNSTLSSSKVCKLPTSQLKSPKQQAAELDHNNQRLSVPQAYRNFKRSLYEAAAGHSKAIALLSASYVLAGFGYITSATFLPVMATQRLTAQSYAGLLIWLVVGIFAMLSNPIWGALAKRIGESKTLMGLTLLQAFGMCLPLWFDGAIGLYGNAVILGLTFVGMVSMTLNLIKNINPAYSNLLIGLATLAYAIGQFIGPLVTVALAGKQDNFNAGLLVAASGLLLGLVLVFFFQRQTQRQSQSSIN